MMILPAAQKKSFASVPSPQLASSKPLPSRERLGLASALEQTEIALEYSPAESNSFAAKETNPHESNIMVACEINSRLI